MSRRHFFTSLAAVTAAAATGFGIRNATARYYEGPVSDHFDGTRFFDPHGAPPKSFTDLLRWWTGGGKAKWPAWVENPPVAPPPERVAGDRLRVTFVGHATVLLQSGGLNMLLDPVWSERASPFRFAGPKRVNAPGIAFEALPPIDVVLVTHCHYDHLDLATLSRLASVHRCRVITPLGNDTIMRTHDAAIRAEAFDWG
ncbi:MAG: MBL fold metallo-hydrolase, partial [Rhizobiales bacterium]|nr:MBL fold metallo-hydrolase [Hyphomicrobiales bacterium]